MGFNPAMTTTYTYVNNAVTETVTDVYTGGCQLAFLLITNNDASNRYLQIFNKTASNVILGTTSPTFVFHVQANGASVFDIPHGISLTPGFSMALTTTPSGNGAPTNPAYVSLLYY